ncbi:ABC transporter ATP-binding protein [Streptomyces sp. CB01881]|uniref:ABC transporter ATP-binding protein n=1 Tax=Streptomyces sp. CB01881 TaxID=2078691 RepID=UPI000CDC0C0F|nr:ABC transporter ATP-binding protein [Streptomyces sp. CB01881]AUY49333.1 export ABC transporter ATP-binding protein [Streptomyces sp. CB01881]TYC72720.1 ABC transporter ATP-binding protein [Streptomyces sp. CB01881]
MIRTRALRKTFRTRDKGLFGPRTVKTAVDGLDLEIPPGRVTGLLGLNGAGKTSTIKILATLLRPTSGTVTLDGLDVVGYAREARRRINLIAGGERMVYAKLTGAENLRYFGHLYDVPNPVLRPRIGELLELVGLTGAADTPVERYSRGMTQRLSIARDLRRMVAALAAEGRGVLLTSHYLTEVEELCEHVYVISGGRHLAAGSPAELKAATGSHRSVRVTVTNPSPALESAVAGFTAGLGVRAQLETTGEGALLVTVRHPEDVAGPLAGAIVAAGGAIGGLEVTEASLEDAVLALTGAAPAPAHPRSAVAA